MDDVKREVRDMIFGLVRLHGQTTKAVPPVVIPGYEIAGLGSESDLGIMIRVKPDTGMPRYFEIKVREVM